LWQAAAFRQYRLAFGKAVHAEGCGIQVSLQWKNAAAVSIKEADGTSHHIIAHRSATFSHANVRIGLNPIIGF
jgi:hypothetical protein